MGEKTSGKAQWYYLGNVPQRNIARSRQTTSTMQLQSSTREQDPFVHSQTTFFVMSPGALQNLGGTIVEVLELECVVFQVAISSE